MLRHFVWWREEGFNGGTTCSCPIGRGHSLDDEIELIRFASDEPEMAWMVE